MERKEEKKETFTKYETARILGARALQLAMNAPTLLAIPKEKLEEVNYDPLKIAEFEFNARVLPITVKRPLPQKTELDEDAEDEPELLKEMPIEEAEKVEKKPEEDEEKPVVVGGEEPSLAAE